MSIKAELVRFRRVNSLKPDSQSTDLDSIAINDTGNANHVGDGWGGGKL